MVFVFMGEPSLGEQGDSMRLQRQPDHGVEKARTFLANRRVDRLSRPAPFLRSRIDSSTTVPGRRVRSIAFISPKGGAGKTTAALLLALGLVERGRRVAMIDSDPNKPLMEWAALPGRPGKLSVHPSPTLQDFLDARREALRKGPDWMILDTEGTERGAMAFALLKPDLVVTPVAGSQLEAVQAVKAAGMVRDFALRSGGRAAPHRCLLTRVPAAIRSNSLKAVVEQLRMHDVELLPTALLEKEAFRTLFLSGGGFDSLASWGVSGLAAARANAQAFVDAVVELVGEPQTVS
jgi:chromosome partitioning protein